MRFRPAFAVPVFVLAAGCANPGYDASDKRAELVRAGLTDAQARCVTAAMSRQLTDRRLTAHAPATETEHAKTAAILAECGVTL